jgi:CBS domain-containing protein
MEMETNAKDIMHSPVICADTRMTVSDLIRLLKEHGISGVPVLDDNGHLAGVVSGSDVITKCGVFCETIVPDREFSWRPPFPEAVFAKGFHLEDYTDLWVKEIMSRELVTAPPDTTLEDLADLMLTRQVHRIIIVEEGDPIGIVSSLDLVPFLEERCH